MKKEKNFKGKIIAGKNRGKSIEIPNISTTRSSKSILKESLFNTLQFDIVGKNFVEVFAGSGSIGLEALSRGAKECYFIEHNRDVYELLKRNIKRFDPDRCYPIFGNSFEKFDIVLDMLKHKRSKTYFYFDPPFSIRDDMDNIYSRSFELIEKIDIKMCEMVMIEHMSKIEMPNGIDGLKKDRSKRLVVHL